MQLVRLHAKVMHGRRPLLRRGLCMQVQPALTDLTDPHDDIACPGEVVIEDDLGTEVAASERDRRV
jgi:hypothetical protein